MDKIWVTKDGKEIPLAQMSNEHLRNAYKHFNRSIEPPTPNGEMAEYFSEKEYDAAVDAIDERLFLLKEEAARRNISLEEK